MELNQIKKGNYLVIELNGRLDTSNYGELEKSLIELIDKGVKDIIVNCAGLNYISSSGLRVFLMALKKITMSGGNFRLCSLQDNIREIFEIAGFTSIFSIFNTLDEAAK
jgi:anti-anti-sigma factor